MSSWTDRREVAEISMEWLRRRSVAISLGLGETEQIGSGVVIRLGDRTFLASVAHVFKDVVASRFETTDIKVLASGNSEAVQLEVCKWELLPTADELCSDNLDPCRDLAWAEVDSSAVEEAGLEGVLIPELAPGITLNSEQLYATAGTPWVRIDSATEDSSLLDHEGRPFTNRTTTIQLLSHFTNPPEASANQPEGQHVVAYGERVQSRWDEIVESSPPNGMSGGGLWEVTPTQRLGIRHINYRLVGLIRAKLRGTLRAVPIEYWLRATIGAHPELQEHLPSNCEIGDAG